MYAQTARAGTATVILNLGSSGETELSGIFTAQMRLHAHKLFYDAGGCNNRYFCLHKRLRCLAARKCMTHETSLFWF